MMALAGDVPSEVSTKLMDITTGIYEACNFQDITGQRITKVVTALQQIEGKVTFPLIHLGERKLKNIARPVPIFRVDWSLEDPSLTGVLGGAYNSGGPPAIIYGHSRRWPPHEFKSNLQALFLLMDLMVIAGHAAGGNFTATVWAHYLRVLPAAALGALVGLALDRRIDHSLFGRLVLWWLLAMGVRLLVRWP